MKVIKILGTGEIADYGENNYLIVDGETAILIDASANIEEIEKNLNMFNPRPCVKAIFLTHAHFDHIFHLDELISKYNCYVYTNAFGKDNLSSKENMSELLGYPLKIKDKKHVKLFKDGDELKIDNVTVNCYLTPGHSRDSSVFRIDNNLFVGDTVFKSAIGRTDLLGGNAQVLKISLLRIKEDLSHDIQTVFAGHGENFDKTTLSNVINYYIG